MTSIGLCIWICILFTRIIIISTIQQLLAHERHHHRRAYALSIIVINE